MLIETQLVALERKHDDEQECREIETAHTGYVGSQDTCYVGTMKGVGRIYQQALDTYAKQPFAKPHTTKTPIAAADMLNDRVLPFYQEQQVPLLRILTGSRELVLRQGRADRLFNRSLKNGLTLNVYYSIVRLLKPRSCAK